MKTPTLILRLCGLYLLWKGVAGFYTYYQIKKQLAGAMPEMEVLRSAWGGISPEFALYGLTILGLAVTRFAGPLAAFLTLDSREPTKRAIPKAEDGEQEPE